MTQRGAGKRPDLRVLNGEGQIARDERPLIRVTPEIHENADRAVEALADDKDIFQRDGALVHVVIPVDGGSTEGNGTPQIRSISIPTLRERLSRVARWERYDRRQEAWTHSTPPDAVVQAVAARGAWPSIRPLAGVLESPSIRPDGSLLQQPGYDISTALMYTPNDSFTMVPERPSQEDARRALSDLQEIFADFPHASPSHQSAAIAALLTIVARPAICGSVPAFISDASTPGTGKTLHNDAIASAASGRAAAKMSFPDDDVELEKLLGAYALRGTPLICFDNLTRPFGGGPLDRCLTAGNQVELRVLGKSEVPTLQWRAIILASGNNVDVVGDTARRVLVSRLETNLEDPESRSGFRHPDLLAWVRSQRPRLVTSALTLLRAYFVAGRPPQGVRPWGSFEAWTSIVPSSIVFAGGADPLGARLAPEAAHDATKLALRTVLALWQRLDAAGQGLTAKAAIDALYPLRREGMPPDGFDELREAIEILAPPPPGKPPVAARLGVAFRKAKGRTISGRVLLGDPDRQGVIRWRAVEAQQN